MKPDDHSDTELHRAICESVVSSVAHFGFGLDKEAQEHWLRQADICYGLTVHEYMSEHPELATEVSGHVEHPFWQNDGGDAL